MSDAVDETTIAISVVVPVYGSSDALPELHMRIRQELTRIGQSFEIVFVDDCGPGNSLEILQSIAANDSQVVVLEMLRNVGQLSATVQGIAESQGRYIVTIDDDLQQWPEDIGALFNEIESKNLDLVVGRFPIRKHSVFRNVASELTRRMAVRSLPVLPTTHFSSFRIMRREVFERYFGNGSIGNPVPGWMYFTAPRHGEIDVRHAERQQGESTYSMRLLVRSARPLLSGLIDIGLQIAVTLSIIQVAVAFLGGVYLGYQYVAGNIDSPGFTSIVFLLLAIIGLLGVGIAMLAQYLRSIKSLILNKPSSLVRSVIRSKH